MYEDNYLSITKNNKNMLYYILNNIMKEVIDMKKRVDFLFVEKVADVYTISMTPELQDDVGTVGFVEYMDEDVIHKDDPILNLEASKTILEIASPLAGKIVERNEAAISEPTLLNSAKETENWIVKLTDVDEEAFNTLEDA